LSITPTDRHYIVSIKDQELACLTSNGVERIYPISTSKNPPSCQENSFGTPLGLHSLADFIGTDEPINTVFKARVSTGKRFQSFAEEERSKNLITSRIIRLRGLEPGRNAGNGIDSYDRYIYIHGTNHENRVGKPFSGGCIEMVNSDIIHFYNNSQPDALLWIV